jgi:hypothetical protein
MASRRLNILNGVESQMIATHYITTAVNTANHPRRKLSIYSSM